MDPKVSILMGIYNCSNTLEEAVNSIKGQSYKNWEIILCDDGSTDDTYDVAQRLSELNPKIKLIKNKTNLGLAATLNHCFKYADGSYIARMDGDDRCAPKRLEREVQFLEEHQEYDFVSTGMEFFDENGVYGHMIYREIPLGRNFIKGSQFCHAACMIRTEVLKAVGGYRISKHVERVEDYDLWLRLYEKSYKGYNIQEILYSMRDDRNAYQRRKMKYRMNESRMIWRAARLYGEGWLCRIYAVKPILLGCIPMFLYRVLHRKRLNR